MGRQVSRHMPGDGHTPVGGSAAGRGPDVQEVVVAAAGQLGAVGGPFQAAHLLLVAPAVSPSRAPGSCRRHARACQEAEQPHTGRIQAKQAPGVINVLACSMCS